MRYEIVKVLKDGDFKRSKVSASAQASQVLISSSISSRRNGSLGTPSPRRHRGTFFIGLAFSNSKLTRAKKADRLTKKL
jgi:hypothetical protein